MDDNKLAVAVLAHALCAPGADLTGGYRVSLPKTLTLTVQSLLPHPCENPCPRALVLIYKILRR